MDHEPNLEEKDLEEPKSESSSQKPEQEDLDELKEVMKKLEELHKNQQPKKPRRRIIAIEFGGVFHHNRYINFIFTYIVNFTFAFFIIELFNFAYYRDIIYLAGIILIFSIIEELYKTYVLMRHFPIVLKSFGTIFYFGYILIFFILDQYVFIRSFNFVNEIVLPFFVLIFTLVRYVFGQAIRNYFRNRNMR